MTRAEVAIAAAALILAPLFKAFEFVLLPVLYRPDFLLALAVAVGWSSDLWTAATAGFTLGLLEDLFAGRALGTRALSMALAAVTSSFVKRLINPDSVLSKVIAAMVSAALADAASFAILRARGIEVGLIYFVRWIWPVSVGWSAVLVLPVGSITHRLARILSRLWPSEGKQGREAAA
jgi:rod shape-determining protein MreD